VFIQKLKFGSNLTKYRALYVHIYVHFLLYLVEIFTE